MGGCALRIRPLSTARVREQRAVQFLSLLLRNPFLLPNTHLDPSIDEYRDCHADCSHKYCNIAANLYSNTHCTHQHSDAPAYQYCAHPGANNSGPNHCSLTGTEQHAGSPHTRSTDEYTDPANGTNPPVNPTCKRETGLTKKSDNQMALSDFWFLWKGDYGGSTGNCK